MTPLALLPDRIRPAPMQSACRRPATLGGEALTPPAPSPSRRRGGADRGEPTAGETIGLGWLALRGLRRRVGEGGGQGGDDVG